MAALCRMLASEATMQIAEPTMDVLSFGEHLQCSGYIVAAVDVEVQQVKGLHSDAGLCPGSLHCALQGASKNLAGEGATPLHIFLPPGDIALALAGDVLPVLVITSALGGACRGQQHQEEEEGFPKLLAANKADHFCQSIRAIPFQPSWH